MLNPVAFHLFGLDVRWYGILIALGVLVALAIAKNLAGRVGGISPESLEDFLILAIPLGVLGARTWYVVFEWDYYSQHLNEIINIRQGGLAIHGGILGGIIAALIFSKRKGYKFLDLADCLAPGLVLAQGIGRWGNFINGEAHGGPTDLPWGILVDGVRVHPTFLYESILDVGIFLFLYFFLFKRRKFSGELFASYGILYSIGRYFIEGLRTDSLWIGPFRTAQVTSLVIIFLSILLILYGRKNTLVDRPGGEK